MSSRSRCDHLSLGIDATVKKDIVKAGGSVLEEIIFSDMAVKINRKDKPQERVIVVTSSALYNMNKGRKIKRRIELQKIEGITVSSTTDEFVIHVPSEYDYRLNAARKSDCIESIVSARALLTSPRIPVSIVSIPHLKDVTITRIDSPLKRAQSTTLSPAALASLNLSDPKPPASHPAASGGGRGGEDRELTRSMSASVGELGTISEGEEDSDDEGAASS